MDKLIAFNAIIEGFPLLEKDRETLRIKRGFSDEVIDRLKFRSTNKEICQKEFVPEELRPALSYENILIPYFNSAGEVVHLRPHKYGFEGVEIQPYVPYQIINGHSTETIVLAESEFKAAASCVMGIPSIGIPGISSFSRKNYPALVSLLTSLNCKKVIVCFDNELKSDPNLPSYKDDFTKRYDAIIYAYIMASLLQSSQFDARIATLSKEWRHDGKADIDGVLAQGIPHKEYQNCINRAVDPSKYKSLWKMPRAHMSFIERRIDNFFYMGPVYEKDNCYYFKKGNEKQRKISNFAIRVSHSLIGRDGVERHCRFVSGYGNSRSFTLMPEHMASKQMFVKLCYELGDYEFDGNEQEMKDIWKFIFIKQSGQIVYRLQCFGFNDEIDTWFFKNGAYGKTGYIPCDEDGIVWIDDIGYKLPDAPPGIGTPELSVDETDIKLVDIMNNVSTAIGEDQAKLILGWTMAIFFLSEIIETYKVFPFLFFFGKTGAGKSTIINWILSFFGIDHHGFPFAASSIPGITRACSSFSFLPVWLEEYRNNDQQVNNKNNLLRSIYDKSTIIKGTRKEDEIKSYTARSSIILSGEEHPKDSALNSRCVMVPMFVRSHNKAAYEWLEQNKGYFSALGHKIMTRRKELWARAKVAIDMCLASYTDKKYDVSSRQRIHWSILAGVCEIMFGKSDTFTNFIDESAISAESARRSEEGINVIWDDIVDLWATGVITFDFKKKLGNNQYAINFKGLYSLWEQKYKGIRTDIPTSFPTLVGLLRKEQWVLDFRNARIDGKVLRCMIVDVKKPSMPASVLTLLLSEQTLQGNADERSDGPNSPEDNFWDL